MKLDNILVLVKNMLEYDRIDLSEGINVNTYEETSRKCSLCQYYYFLNKNFNYQRHLCDGCHVYSSISESDCF